MVGWQGNASRKEMRYQISTLQVKESLHERQIAQKRRYTLLIIQFHHTATNLSSNPSKLQQKHCYLTQHISHLYQNTA